jgi:hypothetical protein
MNVSTASKDDFAWALQRQATCHRRWSEARRQTGYCLLALKQQVNARQVATCFMLYPAMALLSIRECADEGVHRMEVE